LITAYLEITPEELKEQPEIAKSIRGDILYRHFQKSNIKELFSV